MAYGSITKVERARREALEGEGTKLCSKCQAVKSLEDFALQQSGRKGVMSDCKSCRSKFRRRQRHKAKYGRESIADISPNRGGGAITRKELTRREALESENTKYCIKCGRVRPLSEFHTAARNRKKVDSKCKDCQAKGDRIRHYKENYNITLEEYEQILKSQGNKCAICGTTVPGGKDVFCVDHNHTIKDKRKATRGLLCQHCNVGLGGFKDNPELLQTAITYLSEAKEKTQSILNNT